MQMQSSTLNDLPLSGGFSSEERPAFASVNDLTVKAVNLALAEVNVPRGTFTL